MPAASVAPAIVRGAPAAAPFSLTTTGLAQSIELRSSAWEVGKAPHLGSLGRAPWSRRRGQESEYQQQRDEDNTDRDCRAPLARFGEFALHCCQSVLDRTEALKLTPRGASAASFFSIAAQSSGEVPSVYIGVATMLDRDIPL